VARELWTQLWSAAEPAATRWGPLRAHFARHAVALRLAILLHDAGKPATLTVEADGRTRFFGHAELGARLAADELARWRLPGQLIERVALLIEQHMRPGQLAAPGEAPTAKSLHRLHRAMRDATPDLCWLFLADSLATVGGEALLPRWPAYVGHVLRVVTWAPPPEARAIGTLVDGHAVMRATRLEPGPRVGSILAAVDEAAAAGEVRTPAEALELASRLARSDREA
jgi:hypothetical protein